MLIREDPTIDEERERMLKRLKAIELGEVHALRHQTIYERDRKRYDDFDTGEDPDAFDNPLRRHNAAFEVEDRTHRSVT